MNRPSISFFMAWTMLLVGSLYAANTSMVQAAAEEKPISQTTLYLRYDDGLIDAHIDHAPLASVLRELALKTGMQIQLSDPMVASHPISASIAAMPLEQGIQEILEGFSYALYGVASTPVVIVLSTEPRRALVGLKTVATGVNRALPQPTPDQTSGRSGDPDPAMLTHSSSEQPPQSLDEFQPIAIKEPSSEAETEDHDGDSPPRGGQEREYQEALLQRALDAIKSEHKHLYMEAIEQVAGLDDPRATEALVEVTSNSAGLDAGSRLQAVTTLWRHNAILKYIDATSVNALKQLAEDSDADIRSIARQALKEMEDYQNSAD